MGAGNGNELPTRNPLLEDKNEKLKIKSMNWKK